MIIVDNALKAREQQGKPIRVGMVGDSSEALTPGAVATSRDAVWIRAEPCTGICNRKKRSRQPGSIDTDPPYAT